MGNMGRPQKRNLDYFSLDCGFFDNDDDIKSLRRKHGTIGILTWLYLQCKAHGKNGYYFEFLTLESLAADIAESIANSHIPRVTYLVLDVINYLIDVDLIDSGAVEQRLITGRKIQEKYVETFYRLRRTITLDVHPLVDVNIVISKIRLSVAEIRDISEESGLFATESRTRKKEELEEEYKEEIHSFVLSRESDDETSGEVDLSSPEHRRRYIGGIGKGVVMLSDEQMIDLLDKMSIEEFNYYVGVVADNELKGHRYTKKTHYQAILEMALTDRRVANKTKS